MKRSRILAVLSAAAMAFSALCFTASAEEENNEWTVSEMLSEMTLEQKLEQMMMVTLRCWEEDGGNYSNTYALNEAQKAFLRRHNFGGVALFGTNISSIRQTAALTDEMQQSALGSSCGIPLLIAADQEGGDIYRLSTGTVTCGNMALGAAREPALAYENAGILGSELAAVGINTNFAPVLDVNNNPANPVINIRSFGSDPQLVSDMGAEYIKGLKSEGIITACKHFPGHGDTGTDSHTGLPMIDKSYDELKKTELYPYTAAIEAGTDMIMTAHIQFPQIEKQTYVSKSDGELITLPATLSKTFITDILRGDLNYDGVVITDAMLMDAVRKHFDPVDAAVLAINADVDMLLEPTMLRSEAEMALTELYIKALAAQVENGAIPMETIDRSVTRILNLKKEHGILDYTAPDPDKAMETVGSAEHRERALDIAMKGITLIKNDGGILPLMPEENSKYAYFYPYSNAENTIRFALDRLKAEGVVPESVTAVCNCLQNRTAAEFTDTVKECDAVILDFEMYRAANLDSTDSRGWQAVFADDLIRLAHENGKKVICISGNIPYDIARLTEADAILAAYSANPMEQMPTEGEESPAYGENYPAALMTVFGGNSPTGKLPVDIYALDETQHYSDEILYPFGYGLEYEKDEPEESEPESSPDADSSEPENSSAPQKSDANPATGAAAPFIAFAALLAGALTAISRKNR